ncbi:MAG: PSD1 and planctomycete cytochrome C domain-containing protein [Gemmataceae bacterium]|nr:PSD1 and planctomycete cytochrome C domain-containing protein [Gemmataceae bacterium]
MTTHPARLRILLATLALAVPTAALLRAGQGAGPKLPPAAQGTVDFRREVYPLLSSRCFPCHKGADASSGYRLDLRGELLGETTGKSAVAVGNSADSRLIHLVAGLVPGKRMPQKGDPLTAREIGLLRAWIDQGLKWDESLLPAVASAPKHWAFRPLLAAEPPRVKNTTWVRNPIDAFIAARHEAKGLTPAAEASSRTLIRRLTLDLTGLPPTPEEVEAFVTGRADVADERLVERLLTSPHHGERWARHWLDVARWAESEGYESNHVRPYAWRYRDWVVRALTTDHPFDRFVREQVAGDEMLPYRDENLIATGFLAGARLSSNEEDQGRQRNDMLVDITNATGNAFLGLTMHCAQCHSHKFDPISARDYYRFQGFFVKGQVANLALRAPELWAAFETARPPEYEPAVKLQHALFESARARLTERARKALSAEALQALAIPSEKRTPQQEKLAREADLKFQFTPNQIENAIAAEDKALYAELKKKLASMEKKMPDRPQTFGFYSPATSPTKIDVLPMKGFYPLPYRPSELKSARPYLLVSGEIHRRGPQVDVGWPAVFGPVKPDAIEKHPRLALAGWLTSPRNPLTARVWVNRLWQYHFGRGLVATPSDFGLKGTPPTHPDLLDWLAAELVRSGWSTRHIHRLIVTSATYRQSSQPHAGNAKLDPDNKLWWSWSPRRLEAEAVRDSMLAVSGELDRRAGGPSDPDSKKSVRRSLYLFQRRANVPAFQPLFDGPNAVLESCAVRHVSTVPLQALFLLNNEFSVARAKAFAQRVLARAGEDRERQVSEAFALALGRPPDEADRAAARRFFAVQAEGEGGMEPALVRFCQALLNANEFVYLE